MAQYAEKYNFTLDNFISNIVYQHPALYEMQNKNGVFFAAPSLSDSLPLLKTANILSRYSNGEIKGDYLPYSGNGFIDKEIAAHAIQGTKKNGTIYGQASFSKGKHNGYGWNAIRHAEIYLPYIIADSTGGDFIYENYYLAGGYSFQRKQTYYGLGASFRGEIASRQTDPRCANTTTWLKLDASAARYLKSGDWIALRLSYIRNKQHLHLRNWRPNQQDRFYVTYGFGYYDQQESPVSFGIEQMYYVQGAETQLIFSNLKTNNRAKMNFTANIQYQFLTMKTEQRSGKNLYGSNTHHIHGAIWLKTPQIEKCQLTIALKSNNRIRKGRENIYETFCPDENYPSIYDYRLVNTRKRYSGLISSNMIQGKLSLPIASKKCYFDILTGMEINYISESYKNPKHHWHVFSISPMLGLGARQKSKRFWWEMNVTAVTRLPENYKYNVTSGEFRLDYQQTFLPYAYHTDKSITLHNELSVSVPYNKAGNRLGFALHFYIRQGKRPSDVTYDGIPSVQSHLLSYPSQEPVKNKEVWAKTVFFIML